MESLYNYLQESLLDDEEVIDKQNSKQIIRTIRNWCKETITGTRVMSKIKIDKNGVITLPDTPIIGFDFRNPAPVDISFNEFSTEFLNIFGTNEEIQTILTKVDFNKLTTLSIICKDFISTTFLNDILSKCKKLKKISLSNHRNNTSCILNGDLYLENIDDVSINISRGAHSVNINCNYNLYIKNVSLLGIQGITFNSIKGNLSKERNMWLSCITDITGVKNIKTLNVDEYNAPDIADYLPITCEKFNNIDITSLKSVDKHIRRDIINNISINTTNFQPIIDFMSKYSKQIEVNKPIQDYLDPNKSYIFIQLDEDIQIHRYKITKKDIDHGLTYYTSYEPLIRYGLIKHNANIEWVQYLNIAQDFETLNDNIDDYLIFETNDVTDLFFNVLTQGRTK